MSRSILRGLVTTSVLVACHDAAGPEPEEPGAARVSVTYLCGNEFLLQNSDSQPATVEYAVTDTPEDGELILPEASGDTGTITHLITLRRGALEISGRMRFARRHLNAALLPDRKVLVTGGTSSPGFSDPAGAVHAAELWDPATEHWSQLAPNQVNRVYHSSSVLLPDGRVLHAGSGMDPGCRESSMPSCSPRPICSRALDR